MATVRHYHHHFHFSYHTSLKKHFSSVVGVLALVILILLALFHLVAPSQPLVSLDQLSLWDLLLASFATLERLTIAYLVALVCAVPLALLVVSTPKLEKILLPFFDVLQSIPVLAFFPVVVLLFIKLGMLEGAAVLVLFLAMLWNLVFSMIGGLKTMPQDLQAAATVFHATGFKKLRFITLPAIFPSIITGSLLAWAQGWNIIIVAEVLHSYIPGGTSAQDLFGLGSLLVSASFLGKNSVFLAALTVMVVLIALYNFFIWQKLLHMAERYRFD